MSKDFAKRFGFEKFWEKKAMKKKEDMDTQEFNRAMRPHAEKIYKHVFPGTVGVRWMLETTFEEQNASQRFLDNKCHIDAIITHENGNEMTIQEKFLRDSGWDTVTIEHSSKRANGEWFAPYAHWLAQGYGDPSTGFTKFWVINQPYLYYAIQTGKLPEQFNQNEKFSDDKFWYCKIEEVQEKVPEAVFFFWESDVARLEL
jgi:hypothetical protein